MKRRMILMASVLLVAGLCGCQKADPVDPDRLQGAWCKEYPEGVVAEGSVYWTFGKDGVLRVDVYDVFSGNYETEYAYQLGPDGRMLKVWEPVDGGDPAWAEYRLERCDATTLVLARTGVHAKDATRLEGTVTWFEGDVTFRRTAGN